MTNSRNIRSHSCPRAHGRHGWQTRLTDHCIQNPHARQVFLKEEGCPCQRRVEVSVTGSSADDSRAHELGGQCLGLKARPKTHIYGPLPGLDQGLGPLIITPGCWPASLTRSLNRVLPLAGEGLAVQKKKNPYGEACRGRSFQIPRHVLSTCCCRCWDLYNHLPVPVRGPASHVSPPGRPRSPDPGVQGDGPWGPEKGPAGAGDLLTHQETAWGSPPLVPRRDPHRYGD